MSGETYDCCVHCEAAQPCPESLAFPHTGPCEYGCNEPVGRTACENCGHPFHGGGS